MAPSEERVINVDEPRRWWSFIAWPAIVLVIGTAGAIAAGVPTWRAAVLAFAVAFGLWAVVVSFAAPLPQWYYDAPLGMVRTPTPWEVPGLMGARQSADWFDDYLRPHLWATAQELLRRRGIDPASDRARDFVGARNYDLLTGADTDPRHITASISVLAHTIARLAVEQRPDSPTPLRQPVLSGLPGRPRGGNRRQQLEGNPR